MKKFLAALPVAAMLAWLLPVAPATAQNATFTCRASVLRLEQLDPLNIIPNSILPDDRIEPIVANRVPANETGQNITQNPPQNACITQTQGIRNAELPVLGRPLEGILPNVAPFGGQELVLLPTPVAGVGPLRLRALFAETQAGGFADAGVLRFSLGLPAPVNQVTIEVLTASAQAACPQTGPTASGRSETVRVTVAGIVVDVDELVDTVIPEAGLTLGPLVITEPAPGHFDIATPVGTIHLNHGQTTVGAQDAVHVQRAFFFEGGRVAGLQLPNVIVGEAIADVHGCNGGPSPTVRRPQCDDGIDNDGDGRIDYPDDPGCTNTEDDDEKDNSNERPPQQGAPQCSDELDNDGDGLIDYPADPGCESPQDDNEQDSGPNPPQCSDGIDNDGDGDIDYPADPGCVDRNDNDERDAPEPSDAGECRDGSDNDRDNRSDLADSGCKNDPANDDEADGFITGGGGYDNPDNANKFNGASEDFILPGTSLRFGTALPCDLGEKPAGGPTLVTSWHHGEEQGSWKLQEHTRAYCRNDPAINTENPGNEFDTYVGEGAGDLRIKGVSGVQTATAKWILIDRGEPGSPPEDGIDFYQIFVCLAVPAHLCNENNSIFRGIGTLDEGNLQTHSPGGQTRPSAPAPTASPTTTPSPTPSPTRTKGKRPR